MKNGGNRYRTHDDRDTVRQLEKKLSLWKRLFSVITFLRGANKLRRWVIIGGCIILGLAILRSVILYTTDSYDPGTRHVNYSSRYDIISKEQIVEMLGISAETDFASLPLAELQNKLNNHPAIKEAAISLDSTQSLRVDITERVPLLYVEMADRAITGKATRLCLSPDCELFTHDPVLHRKFIDLPVWKLKPSDVKTLAPGQTLDAELCKPIIELARAANSYSDLTQLPHITYIERPAENAVQWKMMVHLENGTTAEMSTLHDISAQLERLVKVLEHARSINKKLISTSVIPEEYIPAKYE